MQFCLNDKLIQTGQTLADIKMLLKEYEFQETIPEYGEEIIFHGETMLKSIEHKIVCHMYFDKVMAELTSMVIHPLPVEYDKIQSFLEEQFGKATNIISETNKAWHFTDGKVSHTIRDRFGEEEMVGVTFK